MASVVTPDHYQTLRVVRGAEDAVIRGAYRALVRLYHPDTNPSPHAEEHLREINAAFAVLGDPIKRATYDSIGFLRPDERFEDHSTSDADQPSNHPMREPGLAFAADDRGFEEAAFNAEQRSRRPMRRFGIASVALALGAILMVVVRPPAKQLPRPQVARAAAPMSPSKQAASPAELLPERQRLADLQNDPALLPPEINAGLALPPAPARVATVPQPPRAAARAAPRVMKREIPQIAAAEIAAPSQSAPKKATTTNAAASPPAQSCRKASSTVGSGQCTDDRRATVERIAKGLLRQSMQHADWSKQQLLLSARNRSATSRNLCQSENCVAEAYVRQIRDINAIMEGRRPTP